ncbi:uncharacterized protein LOC124292509 isoform X2 [Haliotis rubra]|uniref:uncharacterized protein LOC124292509 isoform X2 n=1 Tax=Haliotis rubra TaxID=36100 RepID=UPI001EE50834|nr:uncharacterized protein LOC124292509 isoform X2 [Haliotis rubra]
MKVVLLMLVALLVVLPEAESAWRIKRWFRERVKDRVRNWWIRRRSGKRNTEALDLNGDGELDEQELQQVLGERDVRHLLDATDADDTISVEDFERSLREMDAELDDQ